MTPARDPVVWVSAASAFDYSPAYVFGREIRVIAGERLAPNAPSPEWHGKSIQEIRKALVDYVPGFDYVIPTGQPVRMMLVAMVLREKGDTHNLLGWDDRTQRYMNYTLKMGKVKTISEMVQAYQEYTKG